MFDWIYHIRVDFFYLLLALLSAIVAWLSILALRSIYKDKMFYIFGLFFFLNFALPLIGVAITLWVVFYLRHVEPLQFVRHAERINTDELMQEFPLVHRVFGEGSMIELIKNPSAPQSLKMRALVSMADSLSKKNLTIIKNALSDRDDQIRLYSFAVIDKLEKEITRELHAKIHAYEKARNERERLLYAQTIAKLYWELVYYELSSDDLKSYLLAQVYRFAEEVLAVDANNAEIHLLLGKVMINEKAYDKAEVHFKKAIEYGEKQDFILPYLAEIYFYKREYTKVRTVIQMAKNIDVNATLYPVALLWGEETNGIAS